MTKQIRVVRTAVMLLLAAALIACGGAAERKAKYLESGRVQYGLGNYDKAKLEVRNALQIDPKYVEAIYLLGEINEANSNYPAAAGNYQAIIDLDPKNIDARIRLGRLYLLGKAPDRATEMLEAVLKLSDRHPGALALRAGIRVAMGQTAGAIEDAQAVLKVQPDNLDAIALLAGIYSRNQQAEKGVALLKEGIARKPKQIGLRMLLVELYNGQGKRELAAEQLREIIGSEPENLSHRARLANYYASMQQMDEAEKILRAAITDLPESSDAKIMLVSFLAQKRGQAAAEKELRALIEAEPKKHQLRFALASIYLTAGERDKGIAVYQDIIAIDKTGVAGLEARTQIAQLHLAENRVADAEALITQVLDNNERDNSALMLRGQIALRRGDARSAISDLRTVLKDQPDSQAVHRLLALAHERNGQTELALDSIQKAVQLDTRAVESRVQYAQFLMKAGDLAKALTQTTAALDTEPKHLTALETHFRIQLQKGDIIGAQKTLGTLKTNHANLGLGDYLSGQLNEANKRYVAAIADYELALKKSPGAPEPLSGLVRMLLVQKKPDQAIDRVREVLKVAPSNVVAQGLMGEILMIQGKYPEAVAQFREALRVSPKLALVYKNLAKTQLVMKDVNAAEQTYRDGIKATGGDSGLRIELANLYQQAGKTDETIREYEEALKQDPESKQLANNLAMLLVSYREDKKSIDRAAQLVEPLARTDNAAYLDTLGWVRYKRGEYDSAIRALEQALNRAPKEPILNYHLGMAYYSKGDKTQARKHLEHAVNTSGNYHGRDEAQATLQKL